MARVREKERQLEAGERIRELRDPRPQHVIADAIGVKIRTYQRWEEGATTPSWGHLQALAAFHGVSENYILYGEEQPRLRNHWAVVEAKLDELLATQRAGGAPPSLPSELGHFDAADAPTAPKAPRKSRRRAGGARKGSAR